MPINDLYEQIFLQNRFLLENIQGGIVYSDFAPPFCLRYATEGMAHLCGYTQEELLNLTQLDLVYEEDIPKLMDDVGRQFAEGDTFSVEYRLKRKDGSCIYVLDRAKAVAHEDGRKYIHCLLTDITELKQLEEALRLSEAKYKIAMQQSGNVILEYDPPTGALKISKNYTQLFAGRPPNGSLNEVLRSRWVPPQTGQKVKNLIEAAVTNKQSARLEMQILNGEGRYVWSSLHLTPIINPFGSVYAVVGCLENIDEQKRYIQELTDLSQKDGLTGIYNRTTIEKLINMHLLECQPADGAFVILDLDNFKTVNDTLGHDVGDELLINLTLLVQQTLPPNALFGRLGGDEFLIFVPDLESRDWIINLVQGITDAVRKNFWYTPTPVSVSLGVALCDADCASFKELYRKADIALYEVKRSGRNGYMISEE